MNVPLFLVRNILFVPLTYFPRILTCLTINRLKYIGYAMVYTEFIIAENANRYITTLCKPADDDY